MSIFLEEIKVTKINFSYKMSEYMSNVKRKAKLQKEIDKITLALEIKEDEKLSERKSELIH